MPKVSQGDVAERMHSISPIGANLGGLNGKKMSEVGADCVFFRPRRVSS